MEQVTDPYGRSESTGLDLPAPPQPIGDCVPFSLVGSMLHISGQDPHGVHATRRLGDGTSPRTQPTGLNLVAVMDTASKDLRRVKRVVKVLGMVSATSGFRKHPKVIDGCSDLFADVSGEAGRHARAAARTGSLPNGMTVEVEAIVEVCP